MGTPRSTHCTCQGLSRGGRDHQERRTHRARAHSELERKSSPSGHRAGGWVPAALPLSLPGTKLPTLGRWPELREGRLREATATAAGEEDTGRTLPAQRPPSRPSKLDAGGRGGRAAATRSVRVICRGWVLTPKPQKALPLPRAPTPHPDWAHRGHDPLDGGGRQLLTLGLLHQRHAQVLEAEEHALEQRLPSVCPVLGQLWAQEDRRSDPAGQGPPQRQHLQPPSPRKTQQGHWGPPIYHYFYL